MNTAKLCSINQMKIIKVHIFWEGHKILRNLPLTFDCMYLSQRPDHYTYQVSVYLPSISILIIILSSLTFKYWYWYFLFQKRTEILILQYCFCHQYQYFSTYFQRTCNYKYANISFIWALDCVFHSKTHQTTHILRLMSI